MPRVESIPTVAQIDLDATKFDNGSIAGALDYADIVNGDYWVDQIAPKRPQPRQYAILVRAGKSAVPDHIRHQDRREFPGLDHGLAPSREGDYHTGVFRLKPVLLKV